ncbi:MAG TPA: efflux RND transporter periplasmic adaptor subunit [Steroidobacteraceae bacterium]|jgi:Cu(I)/Ag(I) efflux system membrane fusion protein|nr:efflux RND transporter periplasmic adaptor subunit [Steroidobacteraceae bacterium]
MRLSRKISLLVCFAVATAAVGLVFMRHRGAMDAKRSESQDARPAQGASAGSDKRRPQYWYDPMRPSEHFDKPGKSPFMDMQLFPKYADPVSTDAGGASRATGAPPGSIAVDSRVVENLGVRLAKVEQGSFTRAVETVGLVSVDEHRIEAIQVRSPGWVERLDVRAAGDEVHRGQRLVGVYSPDLLATQQELMIARSSKDPTLIEAARQRLALFGLSDTQIAHIEKSEQVERRVDYYAPFDGYVMDLGVRQGDAVVPGTTLFKLADLTSVWITAEVPETQAAWLKPGDLAEIEVPARPGERFAGKVDYLYPELTQATRTLKVRVVVKNPRKHLQPGMFAAAHFHGAAQQQVLTVPSEAVIKTGTRSVIIVADDVTHFRPVLVRVGAEQGGRSEILNGLDLGQSVVASGQFLIDSEANLRGAFDNLAGSNESRAERAQPDLMPSPAALAPDRVR